MDKKVFINEEKKIVVVVLYNHEYGFTVKGKAVCSNEDTFLTSVGEKIATLRAECKYYSRLEKFAKDDAEWLSRRAESFEKRAGKYDVLAGKAVERYNDKYNELVKLMENGEI